MNVNASSRALLAFATIVAVVTSLMPTQATAQSPAWESKAVAFSTDPAAATKTLNAQAAAGWEYVGPLAGNLVAFKRLAGLEGVWDGDEDDWGMVVLKAAEGGYTGTYTNSYNEELGTFAIKKVADGRYEGKWSESDLKHHGSFVLQVSNDRRSGSITWKALDKAPGRGTSKPTGGKSTWQRFRGRAIVDKEFSNVWWR